jgi:hypothetical protein
MQALGKRHHYGTTGCRMVLDTRVSLDTPGYRYHEDPLLGPTDHDRVREAMMGDIVGTTAEQVRFTVDAWASSPIERIDIRNGMDTLETWRPYSPGELGTRIRVIWEGSEYRGRGRETIWDGHAELHDNRFLRVSPINRYNLDKRFDLVAEDRLEWAALTTGGFGGFDAWLDHASEGSLVIDTALVKTRIPIADIGREDLVFENGGIERRIRVFRMPDENTVDRVVLRRDLPLRTDRDNPLYVRIIQEDGHIIWSSPIYLIPPA